MLAHPEAYNNKAVYKSKPAVQSGEMAKKQKWNSSIQVSFHSPQLKNAFKNKYIIEDLTDEQIKKYLAEAKKDGYDEESFGKYIKEIRCGFEHIENPDNLVEQMKTLEETRKANAERNKNQWK